MSSDRTARASFRRDHWLRRCVQFGIARSARMSTLDSCCSRCQRLTALPSRQPHQSRLAKILLNPTFIRATARSASRARQIGVDYGETQSQRPSASRSGVPRLPSSQNQNAAAAHGDHHWLNDVRLHSGGSLQRRHEPRQDGYVGGGLKWKKTSHATRTYQDDNFRRVDPHGPADRDPRPPLDDGCDPARGVREGCYTRGSF